MEQFRSTWASRLAHRRDSSGASAFSRIKTKILNQFDDYWTHLSTLKPRFYQSPTTSPSTATAPVTPAPIDNPPTTPTSAIKRVTDPRDSKHVKGRLQRVRYREDCDELINQLSGQGCSQLYPHHRRNVRRRLELVDTLTGLDTSNSSAPIDHSESSDEDNCGFDSGGMGLEDTEEEMKLGALAVHHLQPNSGLDLFLPASTRPKVTDPTSSNSLDLVQAYAKALEDYHGYVRYISCIQLVVDSIIRSRKQVTAFGQIRPCIGASSRLLRMQL